VEVAVEKVAAAKGVGAVVKLEAAAVKPEVAVRLEAAAVLAAEAVGAQQVAVEAAAVHRNRHLLGLPLVGLHRPRPLHLHRALTSRYR
jgi:hypothetical protein